VGSVTSFYLERANFNALFGQDRLNVQFAKRKAVTAETRQNNHPGGVASTPAGAVKEKNAATVALIAASMQNNVLFLNLDSEHKSQIIAEMYRTEIKEGVNAIKQGEMGDNLYVVESGTFNVFVNGKQVATRGKGTCFGELALMYNSPRAATVTAATHAVVWVVDRFTFRRIVTDLSEKRFGVYVGFLKKVELLMPLAEYERKKIAEALEETTISAGTTVLVSRSAAARYRQRMRFSSGACRSCRFVRMCAVSVSLLSACWRYR
jgi:cAMP-dependent protein kinase regulator